MSSWDLNFGPRCCQACAALSPLPSSCGLLPSAAHHRMSPGSPGQPGPGEKGCPALRFHSSHRLSRRGLVHSCLCDRDRGRHNILNLPFLFCELPAKNTYFWRFLGGLNGIIQTECFARWHMVGAQENLAVALGPVPHVGVGRAATPTGSFITETHSIYKGSNKTRRKNLKILAE